MSRWRSCALGYALGLLVLVALPLGAVRAQPGGQSPAGPPPAQQEEQEEQEDPSDRESGEEPPPQVRTADVVRANLEPSYLVYPFGLSGLDPLFFEANIAPHFVVGRTAWPFAVVLTPKILLRMFRERSEPVKTPSYMPRLSIFVWFTQTLTGEPQLYTSLTLSHHSNGQTESFFEEDGSNNHDTGDFSTNFVEASLYVTGHTQRMFGWSALSLEWHPDINRSVELPGRYGLFRLHLSSAVLSELPLHGALSARLSAILDGLQRSSRHAAVRVLERFPFALRFAFLVPGIDLGFYVSYYFGHDYYNIWFDRLINVIQVGIFGGVAPTLLETD
jgi:hypothetical protein